MGAVDFVTTLAPGSARRPADRQGQGGRGPDRPPGGRRPTTPWCWTRRRPGGSASSSTSTREVANLTKFGPINRQSAGVIELLHGPRTAVHVVTLLEEMPVQETVDAAAELARAGFALGAIVVNRVRPTLIVDGQVAPTAVSTPSCSPPACARRAVPAAHVPALASEMVDYAERQRLQAENRARLEVLDQPLDRAARAEPARRAGRAGRAGAQFTDAVAAA